MRGGSDPVYVMPVDGEDDAQQPLRSRMCRASFDLDTHNACCRRSFMGQGYKGKILGCLGIIILLVIGILTLTVDHQRSQYPVKFLVVGDWGRRGQYNQSHVAAMMGLKASLVDPDFIVSVGDNFYPSGLSSPSDEAFSKSFSDAYSAKSLQVPWYAILGNHDYGDKCFDEQPGCYPTGDLYYSPNHQMHMNLAERDWRWNCDRSFHMRLAGGDVDLFFIDTSPFVQKYYSTPWANFTGGLTEQSWQRQLAQLEVNLMTSRAKWKVVFGHHPPRSNGHHNNTVELIQHVEPLLQVAGVQAYFAGHDHNLEHIHVPGRTPHYIHQE
ncbi:hypothetical protein WJX75_004346 [Coccomyxa subellipsoidea]|uniref:Calcineurin-like phosphoesterase domain-containing protein n=1 Tax=Coccomyxa subellipsoidea TaxID=248742 RepID=A0ABR2Z4B0_9CHLO